MSQTVDILGRAGIAAKDYLKPPSDNPFLLSVDRSTPAGVIRINEGNAKIDCYVDPKFKQAVLHVEEKARKIKRFVRGSTHRSEPDLEEVKDDLQQRFPIDFTTKEIRWSFSGVKVERVENFIDEFRPPRIEWRPSGFVTANILVDTKLDVLLGMDETAHFIAALPEQVTSVKDAHRVLKPKNKRLKKKSVRQGEWFFTPVSDSLERRLDQFAIEFPRQVRPTDLEWGSTHTARQALSLDSNLTVPMARAMRRLRIPLAIYVCGLILDTRKGHHEPLFLNRWHRVDRNSELGRLETVDSKVRTSARPMIRRMRSWD